MYQLCVSHTAEVAAAAVDPLQAARRLFTHNGYTAGGVLSFFLFSFSTRAGLPQQRELITAGP